MRRYTVLLDPDPDGGYVVTVPALPDRVTQGETAADALDAARDLIALFSEEYVARGLPLPEEADPDRPVLVLVEV